MVWGTSPETKSPEPLVIAYESSAVDGDRNAPGTQRAGAEAAASPLHIYRARFFHIVEGFLTMPARVDV